MPWDVLAAAELPPHHTMGLQSWPHIFLLISQGKAWLPGQHYLPHLGTKGSSFPKLE